MSDLFSNAAAEALARKSPLAVRMRPQRLDDIVGQDHLLGPNQPLRTLIEADKLTSVILWGPPGTGKTTLAQLIARTSAKRFEQLSAVNATVKDVREVLAQAEHRLGERQQGTILFLDEVHRFNKAQQDALLPGVESGLVTLVGATTENPFFEVNPPLLSRSTLFRLHALTDESVSELLRRGLVFEDADASDDAVSHLAGRASGDGRHALTLLEVAVALAAARSTPVRIELIDAEQAANAKAIRHGRDAHYDVTSAFIKSIRGSDPDAALYWLARMLEAGEDARFIGRRMVISASEDIGMADPMGIVIADAAARAVEFVGLPEAQHNLAHAVVYLATAPKSNTSTVALGRAIADARAAGEGAVPMHLRDAHYKGAATLGHGAGYVYPHDDPAGWVPQEYRPGEVQGHVYYEPSAHGHEQEIARRMSLHQREAGHGDASD